jgi:hypothetical protein
VTKTLGFVDWFLPDEANGTALRKMEALVTLAGPYAEERFTGKRRVDLPSIDPEEAYVLDLAFKAGRGENGLRWYRRRRAETWTIVKTHWPRIQAVAQALLSRRTLKHDDVKKLMRDSGWLDPAQRPRRQPRSIVICGERIWRPGCEPKRKAVNNE